MCHYQVHTLVRILPAMRRATGEGKARGRETKKAAMAKVSHYCLPLLLTNVGVGEGQWQWREGYGVEVAELIRSW